MTELALLAGLAALFVAGLGILLFRVRRDGMAIERAKQAAAAAKADQQAHERINNADTGAGATDDERIDRLRSFAARHGNRPPKGAGR